MAVEMMYNSAWPPGPIPIIDRVARTMKLRPKRQERWREAVLYSIMQWSRTGLEFDLFEAERAKDANEQYFYREYADPGVIQLVQMGSQHVLMDRSAFAYVDTWTDPAATAGVCVFNPKIVRRTDKAYLRYVTGHELGHCLGLGHGDEGIMGAGKSEPSDDEIELLAGYYSP